MSHRWTLLDDARECAAKDPQRALDLENRYVAQNPEDSTGYFCRHLSWMRLEEYDKALADCTKAIEMIQKPSRYLARGDVYRALGDHARAVEDFNRSHDLDYEDWLTSYGPHHRADSLARLGRLEEALADCQLIKDDHWWPAHSGLPGGTKAEFIAEIIRRATLARAGKPID